MILMYRNFRGLLGIVYERLNNIAYNRERYLVKVLSD